MCDVADQDGLTEFVPSLSLVACDCDCGTWLLKPYACLLLPALPCCDYFKPHKTTLPNPNKPKQDPEARKLNAAFIGDMKALEQDIIAQHKAGDWTRCKPNKKGEPYAGTYSTCLIPGSGPGVTLRGVPYSVSI